MYLAQTRHIRASMVAEIYIYIYIDIDIDMCVYIRVREGTDYGSPWVRWRDRTLRTTPACCCCVVVAVFWFPCHEIMFFYMILS